MNAYYLLTKRPLRAYETHKKWLVERLSRAPQSTATAATRTRREAEGRLGYESAPAKTGSSAYALTIDFTARPACPTNTRAGPGV